MKLAWAKIKGGADLHPPFECQCDPNTRFDQLGLVIAVDLHSVFKSHIFCYGCKYQDPPDLRREVVKVVSGAGEYSFILLGAIEMDEGMFDPNCKPT